MSQPSTQVDGSSIEKSLTEWYKEHAPALSGPQLQQAVQLGMSQFRTLPIEKQREIAAIRNVPEPVHHHEPTLRQDPAIERWRDMRDHIHEGFRFTRYNTGPALFYAAVIPVAFFAVTYYTKDRWSWMGKERGESLLKRPPPSPSQ
ncbi:hypothetical protein CALVIDRAFT_599309 [Calocera viscosa TUFC12733]|uniref:NADH-ubiquinone oxidoreductase B15 subunit n=1 Tax=Calocera viscosa (strain TUFC12733) TaxID=1330018 RepID=A0A167KYT6_CALVF|nr:hypothetical protein CALVIDRAFT_599309 [Calocera viscosa TUFC12733]